MSLYNMVHGVNYATFFILPMLGKHPDEYPRFRDCFTDDEEHPDYKDYIHVYTRVGGNNRENYVEAIDELQKTAGYVTDFDDSSDNTFATFVFKVPTQYVNDYQKLLSGQSKDTSQEYQDIVRRVFPKLDNKLDEFF